MLVRAKLQFEGLHNATQPQEPHWESVRSVFAFPYEFEIFQTGPVPRGTTLACIINTEMFKAHFKAHKKLLAFSLLRKFQHMSGFRAVPRIFCLRVQTPQTFTGISRIQTGFLVKHYVTKKISFPGGGNCTPPPRYVRPWDCRSKHLYVFYWPFRRNMQSKTPSHKHKLNCTTIWMENADIQLANTTFIKGQ